MIFYFQFPNGFSLGEARRYDYGSVENTFNSLTDSHLILELPLSSDLVLSFNSLTDSHKATSDIPDIMIHLNFQFPNGFSLDM